MLEAISKGVVKLKTTVVVSGSKYQGHNKFIDTTNGVFWEALPTMTKNAEQIQAALLKKN